MTMTLGQAAKAAGKAKGTILKAIKDGDLSAPKDERGRYKIDPAELHRLYTIQPLETVSDRAEKPQLTTELTIKNSTLEAELRAERAIRERIEAEVEDLKRQRDQWQAQAEAQTRLLAKPADVPKEAQKSLSRGLFGFLWGRGAA
jgi:excisionase family DNA binding protein